MSRATRAQDIAAGKFVTLLVKLGERRNVGNKVANFQEYETRFKKELRQAKYLTEAEIVDQWRQIAFYLWKIKQSYITAGATETEAERKALTDYIGPQDLARRYCPRIISICFGECYMLHILFLAFVALGPVLIVDQHFIDSYFGRCIASFHMGVCVATLFLMNYYQSSRLGDFFSLPFPITKNISRNILFIIIIKMTVAISVLSLIAVCTAGLLNLMEEITGGRYPILLHYTIIIFWSANFTFLMKSILAHRLFSTPFEKFWARLMRALDATAG